MLLSCPHFCEPRSAVIVVLAGHDWPQPHIRRFDARFSRNIATIFGIIGEYLL